MSAEKSVEVKKFEIKNLATLIQKYEGCENLFVIAGGPSIEQLNYQALDSQKHHMIVGNTAFRLFPQAMMAHHTDYNWWLTHGKELSKTFQGELITGNGLGYSHFEYPEHVAFLQYSQERKFFPEHDRLFGANSGLQGLILAHYFAPKNIILLGFDHKPAANGQTHWNNATPLMAESKMQNSWQKSLKGFQEFAKIRQALWESYRPNQALPRIFNASPDSMIQDFEKISSIDAFL